MILAPTDSSPPLAAPGKPLGDAIVSPPRVGDEWFEAFEEWRHDAIGEVPAPAGYEDWSVERAKKDLSAETTRIRAQIRAMWEEAGENV